MKKIISVNIIAVMLVSVIFCFTSCAAPKQKVKLVNVPLTEEEYAFAMKLDNEGLQASFNEYLAEIKENGKLDEIMAKYFEDEGEKIGFDYIGDGTRENEIGETGEGKLVVATNCPFSPFEYVENGKIYGVDMEIAAGYAQKHGLELIIKNLDFNAILPSLDLGYADIGMAGMTVTDERTNYLFTDIYYNASLNIIVSADNTAFDLCTTRAQIREVLASLENQKIGYQKGTTAVDYVAEFENIQGVEYSTAAVATRDVANGLLYAVIVDNAPAAAIVNSYNK